MLKTAKPHHPDRGSIMLFWEQTLPESAHTDSGATVSVCFSVIPIRDKKGESGNEAGPNRIFIG
jgi:hypothetical protein